jgi:RNA polymerase sigma factor (TIGR02999 family)
MAGERTGHSLQATALVNEAFLRLGGVKEVDWQDRGHFLAVSARLMRRILVDHARARQYQKRGGGAVRVDLDEVNVAAIEPGRDLVALDEALNELAKHEPRRSRIVELRFFAGLTVEETAAALDISPETVMRDWKQAKEWLYAAIRPAR